MNFEQFLAEFLLLLRMIIRHFEETFIIINWHKLKYVSFFALQNMYGLNTENW